jgi:hypothetical protein
MRSLYASLLLHLCATPPPSLARGRPDDKPGRNSAVDGLQPPASACAGGISWARGHDELAAGGAILAPRVLPSARSFAADQQLQSRAAVAMLEDDDRCASCDDRCQERERTDQDAQAHASNLGEGSRRGGRQPMQQEAQAQARDGEPAGDSVQWGGSASHVCCTLDHIACALQTAPAYSLLCRRLFPGPPACWSGTRARASSPRGARPAPACSSPCLHPMRIFGQIHTSGSFGRGKPGAGAVAGAVQARGAGCSRRRRPPRCARSAALHHSALARPFPCALAMSMLAPACLLSGTCARAPCGGACWRLPRCRGSHLP